METPVLLTLAEAMALSGLSADDLFDSGIGQSPMVRFMVVVPELGACRVPEVAISHFMSGADRFEAQAMPEHWRGTLSGAWEITRDQLRLMDDDVQRLDPSATHLAGSGYPWPVLPRVEPSEASWPETLVGHRVWKLPEAFRELGRQQGWSDAVTDTKMRQAIRSGLSVRDLQGDKRKPSHTAILTDHLFACDLNEWLASRQAPYTFNEDGLGGSNWITTKEAGRTSSRTPAGHAEYMEDRDERWGRGIFGMEEAAQLVADLNVGVSAEAVLCDLVILANLPAGDSSKLEVLHSHVDRKAGTPVLDRPCRTEFDWVTWDAMHAFVQRAKPTPWAWVEAPTAKAESAQVKSAVRHTGQSLSTDEVCDAFADVGGMKRLAWRMALTKNRPKWLLDCRVLKGAPGAEPVQAQWSPLLIAEALVRGRSRAAKAVSVRDLDAAFNRPLLRRSSEEWKALRLDNPAWGD